MSDAKSIFTARWIAPMDRPMFRDGAIVVRNGRIVEIGDARQLRRSHPDAQSNDLGNEVILPGLVNPHVHLELSDCKSGDSPGGTFAEWILTVRQRMQLGERSIEGAAATATRNGIAQCLRFGVTTVGDISAHIETTRAILRDSSIRAVSFGEVLGLAKQRARAEASIPIAMDSRFATDRLRIGISPHAPYTVDLEMYKKCLDLARERQFPVATHLAEAPDERAFLEHHSGPFRDVWESIGQWQEPVLTFAGSPIEFAAAVGLLQMPSILAHVNYCTDEDLRVLASGNASVVYCPRTHAYFDHAPHRWREMLARGINVAIGTDSCASSPDLNIVDDLRLLRTLAPELSSESIFEFATIRAAKALNLHNEVGSLTPQKFADFVVFSARGINALDVILTCQLDPSATFVAGKQLSP